tara:strand:+ start:2484 stop:2822 length:339 start_codon:yes stop_codon:yes gene_type:complete
MTPAKKKTTKKKVVEKKYQIQASDLARFLTLTSFDPSNLQEDVMAAHIYADEFCGAKISETNYGHLYAQGVLHLAAKFYATGDKTIEKPQDVPLVCRHFFELAKREFSGSKK